MRAIVRQHYGGPEQLAIQELPVPEPARGHVCIEVKGFGVNHVKPRCEKGVGRGRKGERYSILTTSISPIG